jgi:hypothetical protein
MPILSASTKRYIRIDNSASRRKDMARLPHYKEVLQQYPIPGVT